MKQTVAFVKQRTLDDYQDSDIKSCIDSCVSLVETDQLIETVVDLLKAPQNAVLDTEIFRESEKYVYQLCHVPVTVVEKPDMSRLNSVGSALLTEPMFGDCVLIKTRVLEDGSCEPADFKKRDVEEILYRLAKHRAVVVTTHGTFEEREFLIDPTSILTSTQAPIEVKQFGYSLLMYVDINFESLPLNRTASRIAGNFFVCGDVMFVQRFKNGFTDLSIREIRALDEISWVPEKDRDVPETDQRQRIEESFKKDTETGKVKVHNRYTLVKQLSNRLKQAPVNRDWDEFFKTFDRKTPINEYALKRSMRGESTVTLENSS